MRLGDIDLNSGFSDERREWPTIAIPRFRAPHVNRIVKIVIALAAVALILGSCVQYVNNTNARMLRYESQLQSMRLALKNSNKRFTDRVKREISDSVQAHIEHSVSKRASEDVEVVERQEYIAPRNAGGVTYIRWGRRDCPNGELTRFVYTGYMAGSYATNTGGGSNYLCLHWNISYVPGKFYDGSQGSSYIYGTEFRDSNSLTQRLFDLTETEQTGTYLHSVPCSMCMAEARVSQMMIPGREECPVGWHKEYTGYIMSGGHSDKHPSEYVCVDQRPHIVPGTIGDQKGAYLYTVETQCASLLCEPFVAGRELRCVVCTI